MVQSPSVNTVSGHNAGIRVTISEQLKPAYDKLKEMGNRGNHWARVAVKEIDSLSSGNSKSNVFVNNPCGTTFQIILPGCRATAIKKSDSDFYIYHLAIDTKYESLSAANQKPGLYTVNKNSNVVTATKALSGNIKNEKDRIVVISDGYDNPLEAAESAIDHASDAPIGGHNVSKNGIDMQYHYSNSKIGGLTQIAVARNADLEPNLAVNALLLAETMQNAKSVDGVSWISERGGSGVLTQAMKILRDRRINFTDSGHHVFFSQPTTNLNTAENYARDLGLSFSRKTHSANVLNPNVLVGGLNFGGNFVSAYNRYTHDENYNSIHFGVDLAQATSTNWKAITTASASAAAVSAAVGFGGAAVALPAVISVASAVAGLGNTLFKAWLPHRYNAIKRKIN